VVLFASPRLGHSSSQVLIFYLNLEFIKEVQILGLLLLKSICTVIPSGLGGWQVLNPFSLLAAIKVMQKSAGLPVFSIFERVFPLNKISVVLAFFTIRVVWIRLW
jgi:hypothetical protein